MRGEHGAQGMGYEVVAGSGRGLEVDLKIERGVREGMAGGNGVEERRSAGEELGEERGDALQVSSGVDSELGDDCENGDGPRRVMIGEGGKLGFIMRRDVHSGSETREVGLADDDQIGMDEEGPTTPTGPVGIEVDRKDRIYKKGPWSVPEMLVLQSAKREDVVRAGKGVPGIKHRTAQEKWQSIEDYCWGHFVQRSAQQCQDKWESMSAEFKKVKDFECAILAGQKPYWLMTIDERKSVRVPPNFQKEVYTALWEWYDKNRIIEPGMRNHRLLPIPRVFVDSHEHTTFWIEAPACHFLH